MSNAESIHLNQLNPPLNPTQEQEENEIITSETVPEIQESKQILNLRNQFDNLNFFDKREFINVLRGKIQGINKAENTAEYTKFLNECIKKYNAEISPDGTVVVNNAYRPGVPVSHHPTAVECPRCGRAVLKTRKSCPNCRFKNSQYAGIHIVALIISILGLIGDIPPFNFPLLLVMGILMPIFVGFAILGFIPLTLSLIGLVMASKGKFIKDTRIPFAVAFAGVVVNGLFLLIPLLG